MMRFGEISIWSLQILLPLFDFFLGFNSVAYEEKTEH
jgi:hypothetical protein